MPVPSVTSSACRTRFAAPYATSPSVATFASLSTTSGWSRRGDERVAQRRVAHGRQVRRVQDVAVVVDETGRADADRRAGPARAPRRSPPRSRPARRRRRAARGVAAPRSTSPFGVEQDAEHLGAADVEPDRGDGRRGVATRHRCGASRGARGVGRSTLLVEHDRVGGVDHRARGGQELVRRVPEVLDRIAGGLRRRVDRGRGPRAVRAAAGSRDRSPRSHELHFEPVVDEARVRRPRGARGCRAARARAGAGRPTTNSSWSVRPSRTSSRSVNGSCTDSTSASPTASTRKRLDVREPVDDVDGRRRGASRTIDEVVDSRRARVRRARR